MSRIEGRNRCTVCWPRNTVGTSGRSEAATGHSSNREVCGADRLTQLGHVNEVAGNLSFADTKRCSDLEAVQAYYIRRVCIKACLVHSDKVRVRTVVNLQRDRKCITANRATLTNIKPRWIDRKSTRLNSS